MKCPTCKDAKENCCCECGKELSIDEQELDSDPFASEIHGDESFHLMCKDCIHESAMEI
jgi:hypothetical protein